MFKALHDNIGLSGKLAGLSDFEFRVWALGLAKSDTFGRTYGDAKLFKAAAMPLLDSRYEAIQTAIQALNTKGLIHLYSEGDKTFMVYHDHDQAGTGNLRYRKSAFPAPPPVLCRCLKAKGEQSVTAVGTAVTTAVTTADVHVHSPVHVHVPTLSPQDEILRQLFMLAKNQKIAAVDATLRARLDSWVDRLGAQEVQARLMDKSVRGRTVNEIHDLWFPKVPQKALSPAPKSFRCGTCSDTGKLVDPRGNSTSPCSCARRRAANA